MIRAMLWACLAVACAGAANAAAPIPVLHARAAEIAPWADKAAIMAVTHAGARLVAVGAQGVVLLSDDEGAHFRQARAVPVDVTLTAASFADAQNGWAVGNWGTILATSDGGETWRLQRSDTHADIPLFAVHFNNAREGLAAGLWSLLLRTADGGQTWSTVAPPKMEGGDKTGVNFYAFIPVTSRVLLLAAEQGKLLRSDDAGATFHPVSTGYNGSFWSGLALRDGTVLMGGLRGSIYRSTDQGLSWQRAASGAFSSITGFCQQADGSVAASALDGVELRSTDGGRSFTDAQRPDRAALTAVACAPGGSLVFLSKDGPLPPEPASLVQQAMAPADPVQHDTSRQDVSQPDMPPEDHPK